MASDVESINPRHADKRLKILFLERDPQTVVSAGLLRIKPEILDSLDVVIIAPKKELDWIKAVYALGDL